MPANTDKLFVTTRNKLLLGELQLQTILLNAAQKRVGDVMAGEERDPAVIAQLRAELNLDAPIPVQYFNWLTRVQGFKPYPDGIVRLAGLTLAK